MRLAAPALLAVLLLAGCSSTAPPAARAPQESVLPTVTPEVPTTLPGRPEPPGALGSDAANATARASASSIASAATATPLGEGPQTASMAKLRIGGERYAALGNPEAAVTMVEFSDYGCPFCRLYGVSGFPEIKRRFVDTGRLYYVFKDFPVVELHPQAMLAAQAAECAGEQGRYWEYHNQLFADPSEWEAGPQAALDTFGRYADVLELDAEALRTCVSDGRYAQEVGADYAEARALGLTGTPAFIINGKLLSGARAPEQFVLLLEREVERAGE